MMLTLGKVWLWIRVLVWQSYQIECVFQTTKTSSAKPVTSNCNLVRPCVMTGGRARIPSCYRGLLKYCCTDIPSKIPSSTCNIVEDLKKKEVCTLHWSRSIFQVSGGTGEKVIYTAVPAGKQIFHFSTQITTFPSLYFLSRTYIY